MTRSEIRRWDKKDMYGVIRAFPEHLHDGWHRASRQADRIGLLSRKTFSGVVITGMGGSAIGGDLLRALCADTATVPIVVNRGYRLPGWVDDRTLVVVSSYSGNTEETLSHLRRRWLGGARLCASPQAAHWGHGRRRLMCR